MPGPGGRTLRLASYNIHAGIGRDRRFDAARIARVIGETGADVVALQEVEHHRVGQLDLLDYLGQACGMATLAGPTLMRETRDYGNGLLTRLPVLGVRRVDLSRGGREPRGALDVVLDCAGRRVRVIATHLGLKPLERRQQTQALLALLEDGDEDVSVLAGDFNEWLLWGRPLRWLHRHFAPVPHRRTWPAGLPLFALDRVWVAPQGALRSLRAHRSALARQASDHLPLVAELDLSVVGG